MIPSIIECPILAELLPASLLEQVIDNSRDMREIIKEILGGR